MDWEVRLGLEISFFACSLSLVNTLNTLIFKELPGCGGYLWGGGEGNHTSSFFSFNLSFTLKICFEREMERAKLMTAFPSLTFSLSEQCAPIGSLACRNVGIAALSEGSNYSIK